jgi:type II secretion system protein J
MTRGRTGFTLLEVVLAISLTLALMAGVIGMYVYATGIRRTLSADARLVAAQRRVMEQLTAELRSAIVHPFTRTGLSGDARQVRLVTASLPSPAVWIEADATEPTATGEQDMQLVGYRLAEEENESGEWVVRGLERTVQKTLAAPTAEEGEEIRVRLLSPDVKFLALRYYREGEWLDSWGGGDLPLAVEIRLGAQPLPEDLAPADYPFQTFRRVVYLPGAGGRRDAGVRGLGEDRR